MADSTLNGIMQLYAAVRAGDPNYTVGQAATDYTAAARFAALYDNAVAPAPAVVGEDQYPQAQLYQ